MEEQLATFEPDLVRQTEGVTIECYFLPSLEDAEKAVIRIVVDGETLDTFETSVGEAVDKWNHVSLHSEALQKNLT